MTPAKTAPRTLIPFATDGQGGAVEWPLDDPAPQMLLTGVTGSSVSSTAAAIAIGAARRGMDVRFADPRPASPHGLAGITTAAGMPEASDLVGNTWADMRDRHARLEAGAAIASELRRIVLIVDNTEALAFDLAA